MVHDLWTRLVNDALKTVLSEGKASFFLRFSLTRPRTHVEAYVRIHEIHYPWLNGSEQDWLASVMVRLRVWCDSPIGYSSRPSVPSSPLVRHLLHRRQTARAQAPTDRPTDRLLLGPPMTADAKRSLLGSSGTTTGRSSACPVAVKAIVDVVVLVEPRGSRCKVKRGKESGITGNGRFASTRGNRTMMELIDSRLPLLSLATDWLEPSTDEWHCFLPNVLTDISYRMFLPNVLTTVCSHRMFLQDVLTECSYRIFLQNFLTTVCCHRLFLQYVLAECSYRKFLQYVLTLHRVFIIR